MGRLREVLAQLPDDYEIVLRPKGGSVTYVDTASRWLADDGKIHYLDDFELVTRIILPETPPESPFIDWPSFWNKERNDPEWLLPDIWAYGRGHATYAPAGSRKSLFTLWGASTLATSPGPVAVIYLDYEMTEDDLYDRLQDMGYGKDSSPTLDRLHYALLPNIAPLDTAEGAEELSGLIDQTVQAWPGHHIAVIIDTTGRAVMGEENSSDTFRNFYKHTGIMLKRRGCTWNRLDHTGKDVTKGQRGSKGKDDDPDVVWFLRETDHGIMLVRRKGRMGWVPERVTFTQEDDPLRFEPIVGDWLKGTEETAALLDELGVLLDATTRAAQIALQGAGEGRRRELIVSAQRYRNHSRNHLQLLLPEPSSEPESENTASSKAEPPSEPSGTNSGDVVGTTHPPYKGVGVTVDDSEEFLSIDDMDDLDDLEDE